MKLARFSYKGTTSWGVVGPTSVADFGQNAAFSSTSIIDFIRQQADFRVNEWSPPHDITSYSVDEVELLAPIARPGKILAIAKNFADHAAETGVAPPEVQRWFNKQATSVNDPYAPVRLPAVSEQLDYEAELVIVVGKTARHVPVDRAMEVVGGYTCGCDYSVRDWQKASPTMMMGKGFDTHAPIGPWIVTPDEVGDYRDLGIRCFVDDEERQSGRAGQMVHGIAHQIAHLSAAFTLEPGDLIFTGTPSGVGMAHDPPSWLRPGQKVRVEIDRIGAIEAEIRRESGECILR